MRRLKRRQLLSGWEMEIRGVTEGCAFLSFLCPWLLPAHQGRGQWHPQSPHQNQSGAFQDLSCSPPAGARGSAAWYCGLQPDNDTAIETESLLKGQRPQRQFHCAIPVETGSLLLGKQMMKNIWRFVLRKLPCCLFTFQRYCLCIFGLHFPG